MAVYKVPQDVEAEDKLVGPFGFRQFVYLGIAGGAGFIAYLLFRIAPVLITIPLPIIFFFIVLALPLRKEQPMETYLLALLRFYLKPKLRLWNPDGTITYVEIVVPKRVEQKLTKDLMGETATDRLDYLARIMDTRGWSLKGQSTAPSASVQAAVAVEAQNATDVLDEDAELAQSFSAKIAQKDQERRQQVMTQMRQAAQEPPTATRQPKATSPSAAQGPAAASDDNVAAPHFNPYPNEMHQRVIQPIDPNAPTSPPSMPTSIAEPAAQTQTAQQPSSAMPQAVSPDIIRLANNDDLSISAIAHEAHRLAGQSEDEVVINLH
jgi:hypothetical protein